MPPSRSVDFVDVACYPQWEKETKGIVYCTIGWTSCSGALVLSADKSFKPYILTAHGI